MWFNLSHANRNKLKPFSQELLSKFVSTGERVIFPTKAAGLLSTRVVDKLTHRVGGNGRTVPALGAVATSATAPCRMPRVAWSTCVPAGISQLMGRLPAATRLPAFRGSPTASIRISMAIAIPSATPIRVGAVLASLVGWTRSSVQWQSAQ
jgi:hypothetical protein